MASIAYVTDKNMIEYHRLNGNHAINFWKPSNSKKISSLNSGDLLFFLAKGTEKGRRKEKGILGYGKFTKKYTLTFAQMWTKYGTMNGYPTKEVLEEAITKVTKNHKMPEYLSCLLLEDVVFFQYPVYLSEIGMEISNRIESYIYIDKNDMLNTSKILDLANTIGTDIWSSLFHKDNESTFKIDAQIQTIQNIYEKIKSNYYSTYDENRLFHYIQTNIHKYINAKMIGNSKTEFISVEEEMIYICIPCIVNTNDFLRKIQFVIGHYFMYEGYIAKSMFKNEIKVKIIFNQNISDELKELLQNMHIIYEIKLVEFD